MLRIDESDLTAALLRFSKDVQSEGGLTGRFGTVDLDDTALRNTADTKRGIQSQRTGRDRLHIHFRAVAQAHNSTLAEALVQLSQSGLQCLFLIGSGSRRFIRCLFGCHIHHSFLP